MNLDVKAAVTAGVIPNGFAHWLSSGWAEGRSISTNTGTFVESAYLLRNPDVAAATGMGLESGFRHWIDNGWVEGRATGAYSTQQGAAGNDTLTNGAFIVRGYEGDDSIVSGGTAYGGTGNDTILDGSVSYGEEGNDSITFRFAIRSGTAYGGMGNDTISRGGSCYGEEGDDSIDGSGTAFGGPGNDTITDCDLIYGNQGNDNLRTARISFARATIFGGKDNDTVSSSYGDDRIYGNMGDDVLYGGAAVFSLEIRSGNDYVHGGQGNDSIYGQGGNDTLFGGLGADQFHFDRNFDKFLATDLMFGATEIRDFNPGDGDLIVFHPYSGVSGHPPLPANFSEVLERASDGPNGVAFSISGRTAANTATLTLTGIAKAQLQSEWFLFV